MPKSISRSKTKKAVRKRFKITGTGRILRRKAFRSHLLEKKSSERKRRLGRETDISKADERATRRMLGI